MDLIPSSSSGTPGPEENTSTTTVSPSSPSLFDLASKDYVVIALSSTFVAVSLLILLAHVVKRVKCCTRDRKTLELLSSVTYDDDNDDESMVEEGGPPMDYVNCRLSMDVGGELGVDTDSEGDPDYDCTSVNSVVSVASGGSPGPTVAVRDGRQPLLPAAATRSFWRR